MSTFSPNLRVELIANGDQSGTWGTTTNTNLGTILEDAISGYVTVNVTSANQAFTALNGSADEARNQVINLTTSTSANFAVYAPPAEKTYLIVNSTAYTATIYASTALNNTTAAGTGVAIPAGKKVLVYCDGINFAEQLNQIVGDLYVNGTLHAMGNQYIAGSETVDGSVYLGLSEAVTISVASPAVVTTTTHLPLNGTAIRFTTSGELPAPLATTTTYYVRNRNPALNTFNISLTFSGALITTTTSGSGSPVITTVSTTSTAPAGTNNTQLATTAFVTSALGNLALTNWALSETNTTQAANISVASPAVVSVTTAPANGTAVSFSTTGALPTGITANAAYYVYNRTSTTYNLTTTQGTTQSALTPVASPGVVTVTNAPANNDVVIFSTTGALPTGITAGTQYYVINRTSTTFQIATTSGGTAINFTGTTSGSQTVTSYTLVNTTGTQSGAHTETTSKLNFAYKSQNRMSIDLGGNMVVIGNVTAYGTV
jgi:hypothetical protein